MVRSMTEDQLIEKRRNLYLSGVGALAALVVFWTLFWALGVEPSPITAGVLGACLLGAAKFFGSAVRIKTNTNQDS